MNWWLSQLFWIFPSVEAGVWIPSEPYQTDDGGNLPCVSNSCPIFLEFSRCCAEKQRARMSLSHAANSLWWSPGCGLKCCFDVQVVHAKPTSCACVCSLALFWWFFTGQLCRNKKFAFLVPVTGITQRWMWRLCALSRLKAPREELGRVGIN